MTSWRDRGGAMVPGSRRAWAGTVLAVCLLATTSAAAAAPEFASAPPVMTDAAADTAPFDVSAAIGFSFANQVSTSTLASVNASSLNGGCYGVWGGYHFSSDSYSLSAALLYTQMGAHVTSSAVGVTDDYDLKLPYFQIPVTVDSWIIDYAALGIGAYVGLAAGSAGQSGVREVAGSPTPLQSSGSFGNLGLSSLDYGLAFHAEIRVPLAGSDFAALQVAYLLGLANIDNTGQGSIRNSSALVQGAFGFSL